MPLFDRPEQPKQPRICLSCGQGIPDEIAECLPCADRARKARRSRIKERHTTGMLLGALVTLAGKDLDELFAEWDKEDRV